MSSLPAEFDVKRSASAGVEKKATHVKDLQLCPRDIDDIEGISDGDFLKVFAKHGEELQIYCRVEQRDDNFSVPLPGEEAGLGVPIREALGVTPEQDDTVVIDRVEFEEVTRRRRLFNELLTYRPVTVRARRSVHPDPGLKVIRTTEAVRQILGIEWGDKVVIQSSDARIRGVKSLPLTAKQRERIKRRESDPDSRYPSPFVQTELGEKTGTRTDIPRIYLSASLRDDLNLAAYGDRAGVYQPVKVHRDTRDLFFRLTDDLTIPFLLGVIGLVVGIDLPFVLKLSILAVALLLITFSVIFQSRQVLLE